MRLVSSNPAHQSLHDEAAATLRAKRAHLNDVENIPVFLMLALLFTLTGCSATAGWAYFGVYFVARTLHTIFYVKAVQPWRTASFVLEPLRRLTFVVAQSLVPIAMPVGGTAALPGWTGTEPCESSGVPSSGASLTSGSWVPQATAKRSPRVKA